MRTYLDVTGLSVTGLCLVLGASCDDPAPKPRPEPGPCPSIVAATPVDQLDELTGAYAIIGNLDGARCAAERLLTASPEDALAINNLAFVELQVGDAAHDRAAFDRLQAALVRFPNTPALLQNLAIAASRLGEKQVAQTTADALVAADPEPDCVADVVRQIVRLRAHVADLTEAQNIILHRCHLAATWHKLVGEGLVEPATEVAAPICIPVAGAPDVRSACPTGDCEKPGVFAVPDCGVHPEVCAANPYLMNYDFAYAADHGGATFGIVSGAEVVAGTYDVVEMRCQDQHQCTLAGPDAQPDRALSVALAGASVLQPSLSLPMPGGGTFNAAMFWVVFPLFPQRVIQPSSKAAELGCPEMTGPFYHFRSRGEMEAAATETIEAMRRTHAFAVDVSVSVPDFGANAGKDSRYWQGQTCPNGYLDTVECQDASVHGPSVPAVPATLPLDPDCTTLVQGMADSMMQPTIETIALFDVRSHEWQCSEDSLPGVEGSSPDLLQILLANALPSTTIAVDLLNTLGGNIELSVNSDGTFDLEVRGDLVSVEGTYNIFSNDFDVRGGVGPSFELPFGIGGAEYVIGIGARGNAERRTLRDVFLFHSASACFFSRLKFGTDEVVTIAQLETAKNALVQTYAGSAGRQLALSARD